MVSNVVLFTAVDNHPQTPMVVDFAFVAAGRKIHDLKIRNSNDYEAVVVMKSDYFPFGMTMPGRKYSSSSYRYGFQGQEKDDEIKGEGNSVNYEYRMHDPRIGRFFAVDPLTSKYPYWTPYAFSGNQVIHMVELEGLEPASRGNGGVYLGLRMAGEKHTDAQKIIDDMVEAERKAIAPLAISSAITGAVIADIFVTKGWMSRVIWGAALGQQMNSTDNYHEAIARGDFEAAAKYSQEMKATGPIAVWGAFFEVLAPVVVSAAKAIIIDTPYGAAVQSTVSEALAVRSQVESGGKLYRIGTMGKSQAGEAQFWATENPLSNPQAYAKKYGIPVENIENANFIEVGTLKPGTNFITRPAPAAPGSPAGGGGGIEVVTPANGVKLETFSTN